MPDRVLVPLPDGRWLALAREVFNAALAAGAEAVAAPNPTGGANDEPLRDADELAGLLKIPATWIEQKAREGVIPSLEFGRWRRFRRADVEAAVRPRRENGA